MNLKQLNMQISRTWFCEKRSIASVESIWSSVFCWICYLHEKLTLQWKHNVFNKKVFVGGKISVIFFLHNVI